MRLDWAGRKLDWEVVIVDDASPDGTQQVAEQLQGIFGQDHVVRGPLLLPTGQPGTRADPFSHWDRYRSCGRGQGSWV